LAKFDYRPRFIRIPADPITERLRRPGYRGHHRILVITGKSGHTLFITREVEEGRQWNA